MGRIWGVLVIFLLAIALLPSASALLNCSISKNCEASPTRLRLADFSDGYNAHFDYTTGTHDQQLCCESSAANISKSNVCTRVQTGTFLRTFDLTNSHVELPNETTYGYPVCFDSETAHYRCTVRNSACVASETCVGSVFQTTNTHLSACTQEASFVRNWTDTTRNLRGVTNNRLVTGTQPNRYAFAHDNKALVRWQVTFLDENLSTYNTDTHLQAIPNMLALKYVFDGDGTDYAGNMIYNRHEADGAVHTYRGEYNSAGGSNSVYVSIDNFSSTDAYSIGNRDVVLYDNLTRTILKVYTSWGLTFNNITFNASVTPPRMATDRDAAAIGSFVVLTVDTRNDLKSDGMIAYFQDTTPVWNTTLDLGGDERFYGVAYNNNTPALYAFGSQEEDEKGLIARYDPANGNILWHKQFAHPDGGSIRFLAGAVDEEGHVYVLGNRSTGGAVLAQYNITGELNWYTNLPSYDGVIPFAYLIRDRIISGSEYSSMATDFVQGYRTYNLCCTDDDTDSDAWSDITIAGGENDCDDTDQWNNRWHLNYTCSRCSSSTLVYTQYSSADSSSVYSTPCVLNTSSLVGSVVNSSVIYFSNISYVNVTDSTLENAILTNANVSSSIIKNTAITCPYFVIEGSVIDGTLSSGRITYDGVVYRAPFEIQDICNQLSPFSGVFNLSHTAASNGTALSLFFHSTNNQPLNIIFDSTQIGGSAVQINLTDDATYPDQVSGDNTYTARYWLDLVSDETITLNITVNDPSTGSTFTFNTTLVVDNTPPNATILINRDEETSGEISVSLQLSYTDDVGIKSCRYSNYNFSEILAHCDFENDLDCRRSGRGYRSPNAGAVPGYTGSGILTAGDSSFASTSTSDVFNPSQGTFQIWVKPLWSGSDGSTYGIFSNPTSFTSLDDAQNGFLLYKNATSQLVLSAAGPASQTFIQASVGSWSPNSWHHIAITWQQVVPGSHEVKMYIDGILQAENVFVPFFPSTFSSVTYLGSIAGNNLPGNMTFDEFAVTNYVKDQAEILTTYSLGDALAYESCEATKTWVTTQGSGTKYVYYEVQDTAGNTRVAFDDITVTVIDRNPPTNLTVIDTGDYTNSNTTLSASWSAFDREGTVYYTFYINDSTNDSIVYPSTAAANGGTATSATVTDLPLVHGHNYTFVVTATNNANLNTVSQSDGIFIDLVEPAEINITSSHGNGTWHWDPTLNITLNGTDNYSGVAGYSSILSGATSILEPDNVTDTYASNFSAWNKTIIASASVEDIATDTTGNIYVLTSDSLFKYAAHSAHIWNTSITGKLLVDDANLALVVTNGSAQELRLTKYLEDGTINWQSSYSMTSLNTTVHNIVQHTGGNYLIVGTYSPYVTTSYPFVATFSKSGAIQSFQDLGLNGTTIYDVEQNVTNGYILAGQVIGGKAILAGYSEQFVHQWNTTFGASTRFYSVEVLSNRIYVAGYTDNTDRDGHLLAFDSSGQALQYNITYDNGFNEAFTHMEVDSQGQATVLVNNVGVFGSMMEKYDFGGNTLWSYDDQLCVVDSCFFAMDPFENYVAVVHNSTHSILHTRDFLGGQSINASTARVQYTSLPTGKYLYSVRHRDQAFNWGNVSTYEVWIDRSVPTTPLLNGTQVFSNANNAFLAWEESEDRESGIAKYHLRYDDNANFSSIEGEEMPGNVTTYTVTFPAAGTWYVQLLAENGAGLNSSWSGTSTKVSDGTGPVITIVSPQAGDIIALQSPTLSIRTDEIANCTYSINDEINFTFPFTNGLYHEAQVGHIVDGAHSFRYYCKDTANNNATSAAIPITIDSAPAIAVLDLTLSSSYYAGEFGSATLVVDDAGATPIKGLTYEDIQLYINDNLQEISVTEQATTYDIGFYVPKTEGTYPVSLQVAGIQGTVTPANLEVIETKLYVGIPGSGSVQQQILYDTQGSTTFGVGTDGKASLLNTSSSSLGSSVEDNAFIFVSSTDSYLNGKEDQLESKQFLDQESPSFGVPDNAVLHTVGATLAYDSIYIESYVPPLPLGNYKLIIINAGKVQEGEHKGKDKIKVYLDEVEP